MNKKQAEILQLQVKDEEKLLKELKGVYETAAKDIDAEIARLLARKDTENLQSIIYQVQYQKALKTQINGILDAMNAKQFDKISDYLTQCYEKGFLGTLYDLQGQGIPLIFPIDQEQVTRALTVDSKLSKSLYESLGEDVTELKKRVRTELSRGISQAFSYEQIAKNIRNQTKIGFNRSMRIARTEGHRISQQATFNAQHKAKAAGADIVKQWDSTLDGRTRPMHRELDGQIRELDDPFEVGIFKAQYPSGFGVPFMDIQCRCCLLQRARWALEDDDIVTKWDGENGELVEIPAKSYGEFVKGYYKTLDKNAEMAQNVKKVELFQKSLFSGKVNTNVRPNKQKEHIAGTKLRAKRVADDQKHGKTPSSEFFATVDLDELLKKSIGKGDTMLFGRKQKYPIEFISSDTPVGIVWDKGEYIATKRFKIVYSKEGVHAYPVNDKE